ncbi:MAG TPA: ABC transporter substrate-binding protein [Candidatus Fournierella merdipullorum]|uniref:ABC transporter substrate-binding protein n=1 Tax=Candidatus Allofournierella merdipullorum TaxID=2838595 RepID=A0A9D2J0X3_9FIRM|nr:ABC transporter substrate-binding protein [Candidatus Fournierella merdipullorum]
MKKLLSLILALAMAASVAGCAAQPASGSASAPASVSAPSSAVSAPAAEKPATDPSGAEVNIPDEIGSVVVLAPSIAETLVALGCGDLIVGYDAQSVGLAGLPEGVPTFDMMQPDMEQLAALKPDVLFVSNMTLYDQTNPYQQLIDLGVCVLCVPTANSIATIQEDIAFIAAAMGKTAEGDTLIADMQAELDRIAAIGATVTEKKSVYFEIGAAPNLYSFGTGVFLNEMIELIGAENVLADQEGWLAVEAETIVAADPDVILTNVNYIDDPVAEILGRSGWEGMSAVKDQQVFYIDNMASSLSNHNIVKALDQMAKAVYPDLFAAE